MPSVDIVFGTRAIGRLPHLIREVESTRKRIVDTELSDQVEVHAVRSDFQNEVSSFVTIMRGCDNYCTYCVVPYVRGKEISRTPDSILEEVRSLVKAGAREITLLGQNVNSYGQKEGLCSFPQLLTQVNNIDGPLRIRFTTSHPKDLSDNLMASFRDLEKLCSHIHLPVQSGANAVLKKMNRKYTREDYLEKVDKLRHFCPEIAITSDMIVGFPGETEDDFQQTLDLIRTVNFDGLFAFMYSDRPNTKASTFPDKISNLEKSDRLQKLLNLQEHYTLRKNQSLVGKTQTILVEGASKKQTKGFPESALQKIQWTGRTTTNKIVNFEISDYNKENVGCNDTSETSVCAGQLVDVKIEKAFPHSLSGKLVDPKFMIIKGEAIYAA